MKRRIPILIALAALIAASVYLYPRFTKDVSPQNELVLSGNIEAHESFGSLARISQASEQKEVTAKN